MKNQELTSLRLLSEGVGQFIRYWGFRKIHGEIWTVVYLMEKPMSGIEIGKTLKVSKALISPAIRELVSEGLILQTKSENSKTKRYIAEKDVEKIIKGVLKRREAPMIKKIQERHAALIQNSPKNTCLNIDRLKTMGFMITMAQVGLQSLLEFEHNQKIFIS